jgi:TrmH family RNA methyltransferase
MRLPVSSRLVRYRRSSPVSYAFGVYPTLEMLSVCPELAEAVLLDDPERGGDGVARLREFCCARGVPVQVAPRVIRRVSGRFFPAVGVFRKPSRPIAAGDNHVVLCRPQYRGNVGTIVRTMVGFGFGHLALVGEGADLMHPDVVRASMGAVFRLRWAQFGGLDEYFRAFPGHHLCCFDAAGTVPVDQFSPLHPFALVFGSEGDGLPAGAAALGTTVRIGHGPSIDSLNLGVAVGIALHQCKRLVQPPPGSGVA